MTGVHGSTPGWGALSVAEIAAARTMWETTDMPASQIAEHFTTESRPVTKNAIVSHAYRYKWKQRNPANARPPRTLFDRLAELHEQFNERTGALPGAGYVRGPGAPLR